MIAIGETSFGGSMSRLFPTARRHQSTNVQRLIWVDVAKGACIILVVLNHAVAALVENGWGLVWMKHVDAALTTFRMPLFFFASGMFFAGNLRKTWIEFLRGKVTALLYLYMLWSVLIGVFFLLLPWTKPTVGYLEDIALSLFVPTSHLWFIYALPLYFLVTRLLNTLPMPVQATGVTVLSVIFASGFVVTGSWAWDAMLSYFGFFFAAVHLRALAVRIAEASSWRLMLTCGVVWCVLMIVSFLVHLPIVSPLRVPLSLIALVAGVIVASKLSTTRVGVGLRWIGLRTLPIYILHVIVVAGAAYYVPQESWMPVGLIYAVPFLVTVLGLAIPLAIWAITSNVPGLFAAPWADSRGKPLR